MILAVLALLAGPGIHSAAAQEALTARAMLQAPDGTRAGTVRLTQTPHYGVLLDIEVTNLPAGEHGFHIHETGRCSPSFGEAGGHYAPRGHDHGALYETGKHAGDLLNIVVPSGGSARLARLAQHVTLHPDRPTSLFDGDGSAIVVHAGADDYRSQPTGGAGDRIACGVIERDGR